MVSWIQRSLGFSLIGLGILGSACGEERSALVIRGVSHGTIDQTTGLCTYQATAAQNFDPLGIIYGSYVIYDRVLVIQNQLGPNANVGEFRPETNIVNLTESKVTVSAPDGSVITAFKQPLTGVIDPANTGTALVTLLDTAAIKAVQSSKVAEGIMTVQVFGKTAANTEVSSGTGFTFAFRTAAGSPMVISDGGAVPVMPDTNPGCI